MDRNREKQTVIHVDTALSTPIYRQIVASLLSAINNGMVKLGDTIPSVNSLAKEFGIARGSIFKAYDDLRSAGIIDSVPGKGFFVVNARQQLKKRIFLLMSTFNPYREVFYNAFIHRLGQDAVTDLYFHHHNIDVFETLISSHAHQYNTFVIMPELHKKTKGILRAFQNKNLFILDTGLKEFGGKFPSVCQNYEQNINDFLSQVEGRLVDYGRIVLLFSSNMRNYEIVKGFEKYFAGSDTDTLIVKDTSGFEPRQGDLCLAMDDVDLVRIINFSNEKGWKIGADLGIISYNESPLKSVIAQGVSTIGPDYKNMANSMADLILEQREEHLENPFVFIERDSF